MGMPGQVGQGGNARSVSGRRGSEKWARLALEADGSVGEASPHLRGEKGD